MPTRFSFVLLVALASCSDSSGAADASGDAADARADGPSSDVTADPNCAIPPLAAPEITVAVPRAGLRCLRYPWALIAPRDVIEARDGTIYVTEQHAPPGGGRLARLTPSGFTPVVMLGRSAIGLREDAAGALYIADEDGAQLFRFDPRVASLSVVATNAGVGWTYLTLGGEGVTAYLSSFDRIDEPTGTIRAVRLDTGAVTMYASGLAVPEATAISPDGTLVVAEWGTLGATASGRVLEFPAGGGAADGATVLQSGLYHLYGIAPAPAGGWYVAVDTGTHTGYIEWLHADGATETLLTGVAAPAGLSVTASGDLLITEHVDIETHEATGYVIRLSGL